MIILFIIENIYFMHTNIYFMYKNIYFMRKKNIENALRFLNQMQFCLQFRIKLWEKTIMILLIAIIF